MLRGGIDDPAVDEGYTQHVKGRQFGRVFVTCRAVELGIDVCMYVCMYVFMRLLLCQAAG